MGWDGMGEGRGRGCDCWRRRGVALEKVGEIDA